MRLGIGGRLLLVHLALSVIVIGGVKLSLGPALREQLERQAYEELLLVARAAAAELDAGIAPDVSGPRLHRATGMQLVFFGPDGSVRLESPPPERRSTALPALDRLPEVRAAMAGEIGSVVRRSTRTGLPSRFLAVRASSGDVVRVAKPTTDVERALSAVDKAVLLAAGIGLLVAALLGFLASRVADRAVFELTRAARSLADGDLAVRELPRSVGVMNDVAFSLERLSGTLRAQLARLTSERDLLEAVLETMEESILVLRADGTLLHANRSAEQNLDLPRSAQDRPLIESLRHPEILDGVQQATEGSAASLELIFPGPPRREYVGRALALPSSGEAAVMIVLRDVTELRRVEAMRRDFVANASHELRTPVAAIRGYAETLSAGALDDRSAAERFLAGISRQAERLSALIDDLLDLSRIETGNERLEPVPIDAGAALEKLASSVRERAEANGIELVLDPEWPATQIFADPRALDMIVGNLLENALRYTPTGGSIGLSARADKGVLRIEVADSGPGIEAHHLSRIFERFYRVDAGRSRSAGGTGLGLAIAKNLAQQSGGDVGVTSAPGAGSTFWLELPAHVERSSETM